MKALLPQFMEKAFMIKNDIVERVCNCLIEAASTFREDQKEAYARFINKEMNPQSCWVMEQVLKNAIVAEKNRSPLCDDTGIPHLFLEMGPNRHLDGDAITAIYVGVAEGLRKLPGRPMGIMGNDNQRIDQSGGLNPDPAGVYPAPLLLKQVDEDILRLTILMLGGGPAIRGITQRIFHKHDISVVVNEIVERAKISVGQLGCSPCTLAIGIGRSQFEATSMMMEAMVYGNYNKQSSLEEEITRRVNESHIGALGLGGDCSVLATFVKVGPQRASGVRIVAIRPCCCFEPRRASIEL